MQCHACAPVCVFPSSDQLPKHQLHFWHVPVYVVGLVEHTLLPDLTYKHLILACQAVHDLISTSHLALCMLPHCCPASTDAALLCDPGQDPHDATSSSAPVPDYAAALPSVDSLNSKPLQGKRVGVISEMMQGGVSPGVLSAVQKSVRHLESLGAEVSEVSW